MSNVLGRQTLMTAGVALLGLLLVSSIRIAGSQSRYSPGLESLLPRVEQAMKREQVAGAAITIVDGDAVIWAKGFGVVDVTTKQPVTDTTVFSVQSISKMYTTVGFLKSAIKLDDTLLNVYPAFSMKSRYGISRARLLFGICSATGRVCPTRRLSGATSTSAMLCSRITSRA